MVFILSKLFTLLLHPLTWVVVLLIFAVKTKNQKRKNRLLLVATITLFVFSNPLLADSFARLWDIGKYKPDNKQYSAVILLGGFVSEDEEGKGYFNWAADRYIQATKLVMNKKAQKILFTGGNADINPDGFTEAAFVKTELKKLNFADSTVIMETRSRNTLENAAYSKPLLQKAGLKPPYLLVTSAFHMRRAALIFKKAGISAISYPSNYMYGKQEVTLMSIVPSAEALLTWNLYLKEIVGYLVAWIK
ncbi:YdcF family protein [Inquilinus sp. KBS0705]|nr:YdcF family protein [Inquilinus sp. KBS0705]